MVITFAGTLQQASVYCMYLIAELFSRADDTRCCCGTLNRRAALQSRHGLVLFPPARQFFSSLIDWCLKYKNKENPKTGTRPGPHLNYDVKIGPIKARLKCRALVLPSVEIKFLPRAPPPPSSGPYNHPKFPPLTAPMVVVVVVLSKFY